MGLNSVLKFLVFNIVQEHQEDEKHYHETNSGHVFYYIITVLRNARTRKANTVSLIFTDEIQNGTVRQ